MSRIKREQPAPEPGQRWGVLGGAFDPIHLGHLNLARQIQSRCNLYGVIFVPAAKPPHRDNSGLSPFEVRLEMTDLGIYGEQVFFVSSIEKDRQLSGFTSDTLNALRTRFPGVVFDLIVGGDQAAVFDTWHEPQEILSLSRLLVGARPGFPLKIPGSLDHSRIETVAIEMLDLSSSDIRRLVKSGIAESDLSAMVPAPVAEYIVRHRLYRP